MSTGLRGGSSTAGSPLGPALLRLRDVSVEYTSGHSWFSRQPAAVLQAVDGVDLDLYASESLGLVGESGCGKSTLARTIVGLQDPSRGEIRFGEERIDRPRPSWVPRTIQIVFQDPYSSLNPRMTVGQTISEMLRVHSIVPKPQIDGRVDELIELVGLTRLVRDAYPRQLSGGQRQRVGIARALSLEPRILVADEPVSALDVSVQATILELLEDLRERLDLSLLLIAHDLAVVRQVCDRVAVMYLGRIVEQGPVESIFADPRHPYTRALLRAVPSLDPTRRSTEVAAPGEPPSPYAIPSGCRFNPRCPIARSRCQTDEPGLEARTDIDRSERDAHLAACHFSWRLPEPGDGGPLQDGPPNERLAQ